MTIKQGDKVKFLNENGEGTVSSVKGDIAQVLTSDGFEIPYSLSELLKVEETVTGYNSAGNEPAPEKKKVEIVPQYSKNEDVNVYLAYVPVNQAKLTDSEIKAYIVNDSNYFIFYNIEKLEGENFKSINGILEPNLKTVFSDFSTSEVSEKTELNVQLIFFDKRAHKLREPFSKFLKISDIKFYKESSFTENDFFDEFAMIIPVLEDNEMKKALQKLTETEIENVKKTKEKKSEQKTFKKPENLDLKEVDLHLHELIDDETGLSDHEKLKIQLDKFHSEMKDAIKSGYKKIVFIHGVGNGTLKLELRRELQRVYKKFQFQDASFREYGFGATMVLLKQ